MKVGDLVQVIPVTRYPEGHLVKGWDTCPGEHGFHRPVWVGSTIAIILENRDVYWRILVPGGSTAWVEHYRIGNV